MILFVHKIVKKINTNYYTILIFICFIISILLPFIVYWITRYHIFYNLSKGEYGLIGDSIGGITAPFIGLINAILLFITLATQNSYNKKQNSNNDRDTLLRLYFDIKESIDKLTYRKDKEDIRTGINAILFLSETLSQTDSNASDINKDPEMVKIAYELKRLDGFLNMIKEFDGQKHVKDIIRSYCNGLLTDILNQTELTLCQIDNINNYDRLNNLLITIQDIIKKNNGQ